MSERTNEYAILSRESYTTSLAEKELIRGGRKYQVEDSVADPLTGFYATAFRDTENGRTIIAYRGTDDILDGAVDLAMATARLDLQQYESEMFTRRVLERAREFAEASGNPLDVTVTGHSLGGGLAEANAARFDLHGETFNAYGSAGLIRGTPEGGSQVINHVRAGDPVSAASRHFGEVKVYATADDIATLGRAGYGEGETTGFGTTVRSITLGSHSMSNFIPKDGEAPLIGPEGEARYRANQEMVDHYRSDVLRARESVTRASESPSLLGPEWAIRAGRAYGEQLADETRVLAAHSAPLAQQAGRGAVETSRAIGTGASQIGTWAVEGLRAMDMVPEPALSTVWGSRTGSPELDRLLHPPKLTDANHPDHAMFQQARRGVHALDAETGRSPDHMSENLAASLTVEARRQGLSRIDHVVLNDDASRACAVQGSLQSPFRQVAVVPTEVGIATSIEKSSAQWQVAASEDRAQQDLAAQTQHASQVDAPQLPAVSHAGPTMSR